MVLPKLLHIINLGNDEAWCVFKRLSETKFKKQIYRCVELLQKGMVRTK